MKKLELLCSCPSMRRSVSYEQSSKFLPNYKAASPLAGMKADSGIVMEKKEDYLSPADFVQVTSLSLQGSSEASCL